MLVSIRPLYPGPFLAMLPDNDVSFLLILTLSLIASRTQNSFMFICNLYIVFLFCIASELFVSLYANIMFYLCLRTLHFRDKNNIYVATVSNNLLFF